ncbi:SagB family peptide dehydrogenase [Paenibacillus sp. MBLB4367]|uniref:SagB family peptide dehydrogenase n=1 Tax=Paenibacillus sp. MBLB4367 TaxID=3384767 RepID=UPI003908242D
MNGLETFLHQLHFDVVKTKPPDLTVDWEDGPLAYKLYRGLPTVSLAPEVPLTLERGARQAKADLRSIGHLLWYSFGLSQMSQSVNEPVYSEQTTELLESFRRFAPSGGALYPNECYVYLKAEDLPAGVYHYDAAHHRLVLLREGIFDSFLSRALGNRFDLSACFGAVFVSTMFWKNFYKYHNFAYRLQGLDAGVLIGQLLEAAKRFGYVPGVSFRFLDRAVNRLLGLTEQEESVYAVIPLSVRRRDPCLTERRSEESRVSASSLCRELEPVRHQHFVKSRRVKAFPMLIQMNEASMLETIPPLELRYGKEEGILRLGQTVFLPRAERLSYDLASVSRKRHSPNQDFAMGKVSQTQLAVLLQEATASFRYANDLDGAPKNNVSRVTLYCCLYNVEGVPDGAYRYDESGHLLQRIRQGDHRLVLQLGLSVDNVNMLQVPLCFHVAGNRDHHLPELGYRGYRIQQMEAGMLVQRLLLAASAIGMGGHPLLGFDARLSDELYRMPANGTTSLIQIPVGPYRPSPRLSGGLHG